MKQTIEIDVPDGHKAVWNNNKVEFVKIQPELPKTWEEFCITNPIKKGEAYINDSSNVKTCETQVTRLAATSRKYLPNKEAANQHLVLIQLHQLRDCYRQGWKPDWKDGNQKKYIVACRDYNFIEYNYYSPYFLAFQSKEIAEKFEANFIDLIKQAKDLIYI